MSAAGGSGLHGWGLLNRRKAKNIVVNTHIAAHKTNINEHFVLN
jgi:hypothetical protein